MCYCLRFFFFFFFSSFPALWFHSRRHDYEGGGGVYAIDIDVAESDIVTSTSSKIFGTGDDHEHYLNDGIHQMWNKNDHHGSATSRHLRKRKKKEAFEYPDSHQYQKFPRSSATTTTTEIEEQATDGPPVPILSDLEVCFMQNDFTLHYRSSPKGRNSSVPVSNIPVPDSAFNDGLFIQNVTKLACSDDGGKLNAYCLQIGQVYCKYCVFDESMMKTSMILEVDSTLSSSLPKCREEVSKIAEKCKETNCIDSRPLAVERKNNTDSTSDVNHHQRKVLQDDNVLGNDKAHWMTSLAANLGIDSHLVRLVDFVLPGSHNSAAVKMSDNFCSDSSALGNFVLKLILASDTKNKVAKCQETSIWNQLEAGIRYFDIRVVDDADFGGLRYPLHHTYLIDDQVNTMEKALEVFSRFLDKNPGEFVIARIKSRVCESPFNFLPIGSSEGGWKDEFHRLQGKFPRVQVYNFWTKFTGINDLRGNIYVDIEGLHEELYTPDSGVDGTDYSIGDGNPFEIANNIRESGFKQDFKKFNVWSFFPAPSESQLAWAATFFTHDGLEDWDANFQKHVWLMHTLIAHEGLHVNAIIRDRATTRKNIYHVATQLTLYRIFDKVGNILPGLDTVASHEYVNEFDEKFEHRCPVGWILGGAMSIHSNHREDRVWKFSCVRVYWVSRSSLWYDYNQSRWRSDLHDNIWRPNTEINTVNNWDSVLNYGWYDCKRAITGIGGVHNNHREDRRFWLYSSGVKGAHSSTCRWTGWINGWDGQMDTSLGVNKYIGAIYSVHNNKREDRLWQFCVCDKY